MLDRAEAHLGAGWRYTTSLPRGSIRVRLACAWPILIGHKTLGLLRKGNVLEPGNRVKIRRSELRALLIRSVLYYPFSRAWNGLFPRKEADFGAGNATIRARTGSI
jgi:farnesyl-diphosphate farnesyltransferase